ncbi:helix-turn-helix transcriptional regulator [Erysipelothrix sp. HDW6A]|uniref:helix-turn-helix domain-containing protein n=1 Tax=Erysipelothrix sp. HDW6A TaxID=2714928 RepID=UPI001408FDFC|nr:helix-turn-helix transcriptional regulator [Erysipelothrix sp. HDW6A]QIK57024.1 helix-turn-helix transcriptional regulator [Erysipelothrix sp. HDW6A]
MSIHDDVKKRMDKENLTIVELSNITGLSRTTLYSFFEKNRVGKGTIEKLEKFLEFSGSYRKVEDTINIGQLRIPKEHYDYLNRFAEEQGVSILDMVRLTIENTVENDYLWKSFSDHINLTEKAVRNVMTKVFIPFIKQQDKTINNIENLLEYVEELVIQQGWKDHSNPELREQFKLLKEQSFKRTDARRYKRTKV